MPKFLFSNLANLPINKVKHLLIFLKHLMVWFIYWHFHYYVRWIINSKPFWDKQTGESMIKMQSKQFHVEVMLGSAIMALIMWEAIVTFLLYKLKSRVDPMARQITRDYDDFSESSAVNKLLSTHIEFCILLVIM